MVRICAWFLLLGSSLAAQTTLQFRPLAAGYSRALDRIIMTAEAPNSLHIYDPVADSDVVVALPASPLSLSVLPNGLSAAVGMDGKIVMVDLAAGTVGAIYPVTGRVSSLVASNSYVHFDDRGAVRSVSLSTGALAPTAGTIYATIATSKLHPSGNWIYVVDSSLLRRIDISTGPATSIDQEYTYRNYSVICGDIWTLAGGTRLATECGGVFSTTNEAATDRKYQTTLTGIGLIRHIAESATLSRVAALSTGIASYYVTAEVPLDNEILLYSNGTFQELGRLRLNDFVVNTIPHQARGKWIFFDNAGNTLYAVMQADSRSGLLRDFAVQTFSLSNPAPCVPVLSTASAISAPWNGATGFLNVSAPGCLYGTTSSEGWLQVMGAAQNGGPQKVRYHASANMGATARTATLTIGGVALTVTQDAAPAPLPSSWRLSHPVVDAEKSESLDKIVLVSNGPNALHLFDTATGTEQTIPLPRAPLSIGVRPDGQMAAVGYDGAVGLVNLQTMQVGQNWLVPLPVRDVIYGSNGYVYLFPRSDYWRVYSLDTATGTLTVYPRLNEYGARLQPGGPFIYSGHYTGGKFTTANGALEAVTSVPNDSVCGDLWFSQDGGRAYTPCGSMLRTSAIPAQDLLSNGDFFADRRYVDWVDHSAANSSTVVLSQTENSPYSAGVFLFGDESLGLSSTRALPVFRVGTTDHRTRAKFAFWGANGANIGVFARVDESAKLKDDMFVHRIIPNIGVGGCTATLSGTSAAVAAGGEGGTLGVVSGDTCNWTS
ncbi:MAG: BACON domain-containing protein, partial [Bryobacterales bacterium]|nr:BACON domain-containing protein [Bryobacterales bacterium]